LAEVVRRDICRHADRDAAGTVDEEIRKFRRKDEGLLQRPVEVVHPVDRVLLEVLEHRLGGLRETALRVSHRGGLVLGAPPVSLAIDERVPQREVLDHPRQGILDREVPMWMSLAKNFLDEGRSFLVRLRCTYL